jgi:hypothetical protein
MIKQLGAHPLKPSGYITYHQVAHSNLLRSAHTVYLRVSYGSKDKRQLLPYTTLTGFHNQNGVCLLRGTDWVFKHNSDLILVVTR